MALKRWGVAMGVICLMMTLSLIAYLWWKQLGSRQSEQPEKADTYALAIVGEASYQPALRSVVGRGEVRHYCIANVSLEDNSPHDSMAVVVRIDGNTVGYLSRADARRYRRRISPSIAPIDCPAIIVGGGRGRSLGVWLDIAI